MGSRTPEAHDTKFARALAFRSIFGCFWLSQVRESFRRGRAPGRRVLRRLRAGRLPLVDVSAGL